MGATIRTEDVDSIKYTFKESQPGSLPPLEMRKSASIPADPTSLQLSHEKAKAKPEDRRSARKEMKNMLSTEVVAG